MTILKSKMVSKAKHVLYKYEIQFAELMVLLIFKQNIVLFLV